MPNILQVNHNGNIQEFETVEAGFAAAVSGDLLTLLEDATASQVIQISNIELEFDLNGKSLVSASGKCVFALSVGGELLVKDTSEEQTGLIQHTKQSGIYLENISDINKCPVFTLDSGTIQAQEFGICTFGGGIININGGTIIAKDNGAIGSNGSNTATKPYGQYPYEINITGGNIFANTETAGYANCAIYHANAGKVNISGGNIVSTAGAGVVVRGGDLNITGGTISGQGDSAGQKMGDATPTYCGGVEICNAANYPGKMGRCVISGGTIESLHNYGVLVIGDPEEYPNAENSKAVISGGSIQGELGAVAFVDKGGEIIEDAPKSKLTIVGGSFNSDVAGFVDPSVNLSVEYDSDGNMHYVIKDGMKAVISYLDDILDSGKANDAEILLNIKDMLNSISDLNIKSDSTNSMLDSMKTDLTSAKDSLADIKEISQSSQSGTSASNEKLSELITINENLIALQQASLAELKKISGDDSPSPVITVDQPEIISIKALIENAKRTGQSSAIWQHPMSNEVKQYLDDNNITYSVIPTAKLGDQWLITISE